MSLNWKEIDLVLSELDLQGGQIQKIIQPTFRSILFTIHTPRKGTTKLYFDFTPGSTRFHRVLDSVEKEIPTQRFVQFCKRHLVNRRILSIGQMGQERIVRIELTPKENPTYLYVRLWSNRGNMYVTDTAGSIEDQLFRQEREKAESRGEWKVFQPEIPESYDEDGREIRSWEGVDFNQFLETYYLTNRVERDFESLKKEVIPPWERELRALERSLAKIETSQNKPELHNIYKRYGDLILSNLYRLKRGMEYAELEDYESSPQGVVQKIPLRPELTPKENAEKYYKQFRTARGELEHLEAQREELSARRAHLIDLLHTAKNLECSKESVVWLQKKRNRNNQSEQKKQSGKKIPGLQFYSGDYTILIGRGATENEELLRSYVRGNDYWLHTRDTPGAYVFIKRKGQKTIPLEILLDAGNLAIHYSKAKKSAKADLYYTQVKYLRKVKGGKKGLVLPTQEKNLYITVEEERIQRLLSSKETP